MPPTSAHPYLDFYGHTNISHSDVLYKISEIGAYGATTANYTRFSIGSSNLPDSKYYSQWQWKSDPGSSLRSNSFYLMVASISYKGTYPSSNTQLQPLQGSLNAVTSLSVLEFINDINSQIYNDNIYIETKDYDFGSPGTAKSIYYVDISYKYDISNEYQYDLSNIMKLNIMPNNTSSSIPGIYIDSHDNAIDTSSNIPPSPNWSTIRFYFSANKAPIHMRSVAIQLRSTARIKNFQLNDITISYRDKGR